MRKWNLFWQMGRWQKEGKCYSNIMDVQLIISEAFVGSLISIIFRSAGLVVVAHYPGVARSQNLIPCDFTSVVGHDYLNKNFSLEYTRGNYCRWETSKWRWLEKSTSGVDSWRTQWKFQKFPQNIRRPETIPSPGVVRGDSRGWSAISQVNLQVTVQKMPDIQQDQLKPAIISTNLNAQELLIWSGKSNLDLVI